MTDENTDPKSTGEVETPASPSEETPTPETPSEQETVKPTVEEPEEPRIPKSRLDREIVRRKGLEAQLASRQTPPGATPPAQSEQEEAKKFLRGLVEETLREKEQGETAEAKEAERVLDEKISELHDVYGDFDEKELLRVAEKYGLDESPEQLDKAYQLHLELKKIKPDVKKPVLPASVRTSDAAPEKPVDTSKPLWSILEDAKREHGLV